jgi:hypothetical protein
VCTIGLTLGLKFKSEDRGVIYQTKGKDLIYTSMQSLGSHLLVEQDLTIRDRNPETRCYSSRVDKRRLNLVPKDPLAFLYEFVSRIGIKKFHRQKHLSPKKLDSLLCPGMQEHVQLCTKEFYPPSAKVDYTI